jgi:uncharacterized protein
MDFVGQRSSTVLGLTLGASMPEETSFRVLSLDGGGMRGTYTATYLDRLACDFAKRRGVTAIDLGAAFDLIVGTSTGGIIACALAAGVPLADVVKFYRKHGPSIFRLRLPRGMIQLIWQRWRRPKALAKGTAAMREALKECLGDVTVGEIYQKRKIALSITSVEMSQHRSWVFKTPHLPSSNGRDNGYTLVEVCLATSAAPIYRSLAAVNRPEGEGYNVFADGGLWANNPVLVGMVEALEMTTPGRKIEIFCIGTCPMPAGEQIGREEVHRGLGGWQFGGKAAALSIAAQEFAYDNMARMLAKHVNRDCEVVRFPRDQIPAALMPHLELDDTRQVAIDALISQARTDADMTNSRLWKTDSLEGRLITELFQAAPQKA